mmetsp:Transcript_19559/g.36610  ORF Transcript_19559/g.36610 Transcript_19559/m.36610 type:complete len:220 (+) Transcript_19559:269-928(+)
MKGDLLQLVLRTEATQIVHQGGMQGCICSVWRFVPDPNMVDSLLGRIPLEWIHLEQLADENLCIYRNMFPIILIKDHIPPSHLGHYFLISITVEWWIPNQNNIHHHSKTPHVGTEIVLASQHLWSNIIGCTSSGCQALARGAFDCKSKINQLQSIPLDRIPSGEQEILRLQVTMAYLSLVDVEDGPEHVLHDSRRLYLCELASLHDSIKQLSAITKFQD